MIAVMCKACFLFLMDTKCLDVCAMQALVDHQHMQGGQVPAGNVVHVQVILLHCLHFLPGFGVLSLHAPAVAVCACWLLRSSPGQPGIILGFSSN